MHRADLVVVASFDGRIETNEKTSLTVPTNLQKLVTVHAYKFNPSLVLKGTVPEESLVVENFAMKDPAATRGRRHSAMVEFRSGKQRFGGVGWVATLKFEYLVFLRRLPSGRFALLGDFDEMKDSVRIVSPVF
ncbi:hypothetical protein FYK55_28265 [Roseiconus nitratireducens]|uniref:Uncharacterized protein n=1 Tax=Roseiconus nitratireducens TaxID=2605748 RepID=A0A5M6CRE4_9BACT|nr:hypothetical protein [Roseiconus nitratireducens]KAA5535685.1 hypothetical protein FYK55_28265 [Roseiconus nitratireducens]